MLRLLELDETLVEAVVDWIDADQQRTHAAGAEDLEYQLNDPPYRAANRHIVDLGELIYVQGFDIETIKLLEPFVSVIPDSKATKINVNTCPPLLLQVLGAQVTAADAESLANARGENGFESIELFLQRPELAGEANVTAEPMISLSSEFFSVNSQVSIDRLGLNMESIVQRNANTESVSIIARKRGYL